MQNRFFQIIRNELTGWKCWEVCYLVSCTAAIVSISVILGDNLLGVLSAVAGTLYTLLAGKGKISCYIFGIFNSGAYGYIAFSQKLYGDAMLNWCWYLPMMAVGILLWRRKMDENSCIIKNRLSCRGRVVALLLCLTGILLYALLLRYAGGAMPVIDSATTVLSVAAMILTVRRCVEQWIMWIAVNLISVGMWAKVFVEQGNSIATLIWWMIMLITGVVFFIQWISDMKRRECLS